MLYTCKVSLLQTERSRRSSHEAAKFCYLVPCYRLSDDTGIHTVDPPFALRTANTGWYQGGCGSYGL